MDKIKMVVTDLDGTLLTTDKTISPYTQTVLAQCRAKGIKVAYATGRGGSAARLAPGELFDGKITLNGALAETSGETVYCRFIPWKTAQPILLACHQRGMEITSEYGGVHYSNFDVSARWPSLMAECMATDFTRHEIDAEKIYFPNPTTQERAFIASILPDDLYYVVTTDGDDGTLGQIMHKGATKAKAIESLANHWHIALPHIVCFGDDFNDIDMLQHCGTGIAMGNAIREVKETATAVCDTNDNDGVAKWLEGTVL
jgi:hypothetical protein